MIGVAAKADLAEIEEFITKRRVDGFAHVIDETLDVWSAFEVTGQPAFVFLNDDGTFRTQHGPRGVELLTESIEELIAN